MVEKWTEGAIEQSLDILYPRSLALFHHFTMKENNVRLRKSVCIAGAVIISTVEQQSVIK